MSAVPAAGTFRGAWRHRRWRRLLASYSVSLTGDLLYSVALVVLLAETTDSPATWVAASVVARMVAYIVLAPIGGVLADRYDRRRLMVGLDLARVGVMTALAAVAWAGGPPILAVALTVANSAFTAPFRPAAVAATPNLVGEDDLVAANAAESVIAQISYFAGPALGALVVAVSNAGVGFLVNAATYAVSAALLAGVGDIGGGVRSGAGAGADDDDSGAGGSQGMLAGLGEGVAALRRVQGLAALTGFTSAAVFLFGYEQVVHVLVADERLHMGAAGVGVLAAALGAGGMLAAPFTARLGGGRNAGRLLVASGVAIGAPMVAMAATTNVVLACVLLAVEGLGVIGLEVLAMTLLQRACPEHLLARVYGVQDSITSAAQLLGSLAAPVLVAAVGLSPALVVGGSVMLVGTLLTAPGLDKVSLRTDDERRRLAPLADRLRLLGIFGDAPQATLERLARSAQVRSVAAGDVLFREGDATGDLYVVQRGVYSVVTAAGGEVNRLAADDWFGEIGLLRSMPRTATVTCVEDGELLVLDGRVFVDAVTADTVLPDPLRHTMLTRLVRTHPHLVE